MTPQETMTIPASSTVPQPKGPYSTTYQAGDVLYLSGQGSIDPATGEVIPGDVEAQTTQTLVNIEALLVSAGFMLADLAQVTVYLTDIEEWGNMNTAYAAYLDGKAHPVRTAVQVADLPFGLQIEMTCIAHRAGGK